MEHDNATPHVFPEARKPGELFYSLVFLVTAAGLLSMIFWQTTVLPGKGIAAQPRTWPFISLAGMTLFALANLVATSRATRTAGRWREVWVWISSLEYVGWYLLYVAAIPVVGYLAATLAFCLFLTWRAGYRSSLAYGSATAFALFVVLLFKSLFNVKIPGGSIYEYLPDTLRYIMIRYF
ncbi:MAG: tripartite tricarboxylate transporter TctB family protein [Mesorhizobium sp.]|nr:tripartite tricarboxylate transporter TctB family protein [Mesorhizobium sp.]MCO5161163.1 tripartite tricarboxylate transporter TctB family protein [Mesorhizobium sp.]